MHLARAAAVCLALGACKPAPTVARATSADQRDALVTLAALAYAAALESDEADHQALARYGLLSPADGTEKREHPLRREVIEHARRWAAPDRRRALAFFRAHPSYGTLYHALVVESFGPPPGFSPKARGPATQNNAPSLFAARDEFAELLRWA